MRSEHYGLSKTEKNRSNWWMSNLWLSNLWLSSRWLYVVFMLLLAFLGMGAATQTAAARFAHIQDLGPEVFNFDGISFYWPWKIFVWPISDPLVDQAIMLGQAVFLIPQFIIMGLWLGRMKLSKGSHSLHGSAHWASYQDIKDMNLLDGAGVYVGGWMKSQKKQLYLRHNGPEHILCFAPTRSGKGVGLILPTLLSWPHSSVVFDIKGENWALTSGWLQSQGHKVLKFDPSSHDSARFNPLDEIRPGHAIPDAQNLVSMILFHF